MRWGRGDGGTLREVTAPRVRVLGPVEVLDAEAPVNLGARTRRLVAALAARSGRTVSVEALVDELWPDGAPANPTGALQTLVSRLRSTAGPDLVTTAGGGYRLGVDPDDLDASRFQRLVDESASAPADRALALLDEATALWNGDAAFAEAWDVEAVHTEALRLEELRLVAEERRMRRLLELGRDEEAVGGLEAFVSRYPLRERALGLLMEALARTGRQTEALRRYAQHREWLAEETGLEPSAELQEVERVVLAGDLAAAPAPPGTGPSVELPLPVRPRSVERRRGEPIVHTTFGEGPRLIYLPGWLSSLEAFSDGSDPRTPVVARLARDFTVTVYDRFGTGMSSADGAVDTSFEPSVEEVLALLDEVGDDVTLFASSASGPIAIAAAARSPRVSRLVLLCTFASGPALFRKQEATASLLALVRSSWGMGSRVIANLIVPGLDAITSHEFARFQRRTAGAEVAAGYLEQMLGADVSHLLGQVTQPALVMHYTKDPAVPFGGARQLSLGLPSSELVSLEGPYHVPPPDHVERIVSAVVAFARS